MAEKYGFIGDNWYTDAFLAEYIASFISNGVYNLEMQVKSGSGMQVLVGVGRGWINGYYYQLSTNVKPLSIDKADTALHRIDNIVFYLDLVSKTLGLKVSKGSFSSNPSPPALLRSQEYYELKLAEVRVNANTTQITQSMIRDTRLDNNFCGIVHSVVEHIDTSTLMKELEDWRDSYKSQTQEEFDEWFGNMKDQVDPVIEAANISISKANTATTNANNAATNANNKASAANTAATNANSKATLAEAAATNANNKATLANTAAASANDASARANTAAEEAEHLIEVGVDEIVIEKINEQKDKANGIAGLNASGKLTKMPTYTDVGAAPASAVPVGKIDIFAGRTVPSGFLLCDGRAVSRTTYSKLYSVIGTVYGSGNGSTTFNLPNMQGRVPAGLKSDDSNFNVLGLQKGAASYELRALIGACDSNVSRIAYYPAAAVWDRYAIGFWIEGNSYQGAIGDVNHTSLVLQTDGSQATTLQPFLVVYYIIKY